MISSTFKHGITGYQDHHCRCEICRSVKAVENLRNSKLKNGSLGRRFPVSCPDCLRNFRTEILYKEHYKSVHAKVSR